MKTVLLSGFAACVLLAGASTSEAGHRHFRGYGRGVRVVNTYNGYGYGAGYGTGYGFGQMNVPPGLYTAPPFQYRAGFGGPYGGYGYSQPVWHDTSHYDYHPGYYVPHGNHLDFVPGHYDFHQSGHYDP